MAYEIVYKDNEGIIIVNYSGVVTDGDFLGSLEEKINSDERVKACRFSLNDFTNVTHFEVTPEAIKKNAIESIRLSKINSQVMPILIAPTDHEFGMSRMWQAYSDETNWKSNIVKTLDEALLLIENSQ